MRRHVPITAPRQPHNWQDQVTFAQNHQDATAYIALAGNDSYSRQMSLETSGVVVRVALISQGKEGDLVSRRCQVNPPYTDKARRKINLPSQLDVFKTQASRHSALSRVSNPPQ